VYPEIAPLVIRFAVVIALLVLNGFFVSVEFVHVTTPRPGSTIWPHNATEDLIHFIFTFIRWPWDSAIAQAFGLVLAFTCITTLHVVVGEQAPKIIAIRSATRFALTSVRVVTWVDAWFHQLISFLDAATSTAVRLAGVAQLGAH
jgi:CBS domain containing-hemolysin-like protein